MFNSQTPSGVEFLRTAGVRTSSSQSLYLRFGKRPLDVVFASLLLLMVVPLMIVISGLLRTGGSRPIFRHRRIGRDHIPFMCLKFQTMHQDSSRALRFVLRTEPSAAQAWATIEKLDDDPRITRFGRFLRVTSLDELPQLINVLCGDMSMVGPRPVTEKELARYGNRLPQYLSVRPGLTGHWQVHGRGAVSFGERVEMDCEYVRDIRFISDLKLLLQTIGVVLRRSGS